MESQFEFILNKTCRIDFNNTGHNGQTKVLRSSTKQDLNMENIQTTIKLAMEQSMGFIKNLINEVGMTICKEIADLKSSLAKQESKIKLLSNRVSANGDKLEELEARMSNFEKT